MSRIVALVLAHVLAACASPADMPRDYILADPAFTAEERVEILKGAAFIAAATGRTVPAIRWEPLPDTDQDLTIKRVHFSPNEAGQCNIGHFWMVFDGDRIPLREMAHVAAHEMGHALGLEHIATAGSMMNPVASPDLAWSSADDAACVAKGVCLPL